MYIAGNKQWRMLLEVALCTVLLSGCAAPTEKKEGSTAEIKQREETEKPQYVSDTLPKDCQLCGNGKEMTLFSLYEGEDNVGIISLNSFEISHIGIIPKLYLLQSDRSIQISVLTRYFMQMCRIQSYKATKKGCNMFEELFYQRLVQLRTEKGVSARDMSLSIGQSAGYINSLENRKGFPSMQDKDVYCGK